MTTTVEPRTYRVITYGCQMIIPRRTGLFGLLIGRDDTTVSSGGILLPLKYVDTAIEILARKLNA